MAVPPSSPLLHATSATSSSLNVQWKQGDDGGAPIRSYHLHYKKEHGEWESLQVGRQYNSYMLNDLYCGTPYQIYIEAYNHIGEWFVFLKIFYARGLLKNFSTISSFVDIDGFNSCSAFLKVKKPLKHLSSSNSITSVCFA